MEHLNNNEIMDFVRINGYNEETAMLVKKVNFHIMSCPECALKVQRASRGAELLEAVSKDDFTMKDACFSMYAIPAEAVRKEAESVYEEDEAFKY